MSTCSFVVGVIERIWSLDKKKTDISKRHCPPWMMQTPLDQSGTNMSHCFRQRQRRRESFFGGGCGFVKIVSVLGISALVLVPQHSWYTGVCLLYCCHEIVFFLCGQQQITNDYNSLEKKMSQVNVPCFRAVSCPRELAQIHQNKQNQKTLHDVRLKTINDWGLFRMWG